MVQLIGRITKDATVSALKNDKKVLRFSIAINDYYKPKNSGPVKMVTYINCSYWNSPEKVAHIIQKGKTIEVNGRISVSAYINANGDPIGTLHLQVNNFKMHGNSALTQTSNPDNSIGMANTVVETISDSDTTEGLPF